MFKPKQKSTLAGLGLIGGAVAIATGNPDLITIDITDTGYKVGGVAPMIYSVVTGVAGFILGMFDEDKN